MGKAIETLVVSLCINLLGVKLTDMKNFIVALGICVTISGCQSSAVTESATRILTKENVLIMERKAAHSYLAEYDRTLKFVANGKVLAQFPINMDTGGYESAKVYKLSNNQYVVYDSFDTYVINLLKPQIIQKDIPANKRGVYIGEFSENKSQIWSFIPAPNKTSAVKGH